MTQPTCETCKFWRRGYRLQGFKVPSWCDRHFHSQNGGDTACKQYDKIDTRSIQHPPYDHPGDVA